MAFILSENRKAPEEIAAAFQRYMAYLRSVQDRFPPLAFELVTSSWYFADDPRSPHDSWLENLQINELASGDRHEIRSVEIQIKLLGSYHDGFIELRYPKVFRYLLQSGGFAKGIPPSHGDWLWDEFTLSDNGNLLHEIEWQHGRWIIEAEDVHYRWSSQKQPTTN